MDRTHWIPIALAVAVGAALARHGPEPAPPPTRTAGPEPIASAGGPAESRHSATLEPRELVPLDFRVGGRVRRIARIHGADGKPRLVQPGDFVRRGTELARLVDEDLRRALGRARARREAAAVSERAAAERELIAALGALQDSVLRAPKDALVVSRSIEEGMLAAPGAVAFVLADVSELRATFDVPERVARALAVGQSLQLELGTGVVPIEGYVSVIARTANAPSRGFAVEVVVANRDRRLQAGTIATARIPARDGRDGIDAAPAGNGAAPAG